MIDATFHRKKGIILIDIPADKPELIPKLTYFFRKHRITFVNRDDNLFILNTRPNGCREEKTLKILAALDINVVERSPFKSQKLANYAAQTIYGELDV